MQGHKDCQAREPDGPDVAEVRAELDFDGPEDFFVLGWGEGLKLCVKQTRGDDRPKNDRRGDRHRTVAILPLARTGADEQGQGQGVGGGARREDVGEEDAEGPEGVAPQGGEEGEEGPVDFDAGPDDDLYYCFWGVFVCVCGG